MRARAARHAARTAAAETRRATWEMTGKSSMDQAAHTDDELRALGDKLLEAETKAPTHPHPTTAGSPVAQRIVAPFAALLAHCWIEPATHTGTRDC